MQELATVLNRGLASGAFLVQQIRLGRGDTDADGQTAAERDAGGLIAMLDGLIFNMVVRQQTTESATETMRTQLGFVLGTDDQRPDFGLGDDDQRLGLVLGAEDQQPTNLDAR